MKFSAENKHALIFAFFNNTDEILDHLHNIRKYQYILDKVLIDKGDQVAVNEITKLKEYEEILLNKAISDNLFAYKNRVTWFSKGKNRKSILTGILMFCFLLFVIKYIAKHP